MAGHCHRKENEQPTIASTVFLTRGGSRAGALCLGQDTIMEKLLAILAVYAVYLTILITSANIEVIRTIARSLSVITVIVAGFLFFGGLVFTGSPLTALIIAMMIGLILWTLIWVPFIIKKKKSQPAPSPYSSPAAGSESGEANVRTD